MSDQQLKQFKEYQNKQFEKIYSFLIKQFAIKLFCFKTLIKNANVFFKWRGYTTNFEIQKQLVSSINTYSGLEIFATPNLSLNCVHLSEIWKNSVWM